ncbi:MAG: ABC transporter ATP-binding protein [Ignavibacteria bacterium]|nr:ABC transporter ATP-binding protein [Ignavibacteria bacterium]
MKGKLLIADEPLTHLDINHQIEIMNLLKKLNENNLTVIIVIHDLNLALKYSNKSILLRHGGIVKFADTKDVITEEMIKEHFFIDSKILNYEKNFYKLPSKLN